MPPSSWPGSAKAAVSITFDNVGESRDVGIGAWPKEKPVGQHPSVLEVTPIILDILDKHDVKVTYFMEAWGIQTYPKMLGEFQSRGHEIGYHAYQHEEWKTLSPLQEEEIINKSLPIAQELGVCYKGFRPPGGSMNAGTKDLLRRHGIKYASVLGQDISTDKDDFVTLPFQWRAVDAFYILDAFDFLRAEYGEQRSTFTCEAFQQALFDQIDAAVEKGAFIDILFHPFLHTSPESRAVIEAVVARVRNDPDIWCAPTHEVAEWAAAHQ
ncbi:hypothetical protein ASPFODRAFT_49826 [Aspergillus luchuensis CBS 106.47]|uniref:NodB homology domain-containing protein n=1 Tax=Aspergillus luchuensis (strain CBS 106.47) TaxID=1137211 RepID=A0A1M3T920_ASPLC|nr:hypothetical protein ASPFODRAFT_49826 [Aspergillus luchuensis CBS 106.47]